MKKTKIRMIFCDLDGTLLTNGDDTISNDVFQAIDLAVSSNVNICIASGRSYPSLKSIFYPAKDKMTFICNDGALIVKNDCVMHSSPLNKNQVTCMSKTYFNDYEALVIYAKDYTYYISDKVAFDFAKKITPYDVSSIPGDVFKVAFYNLSQKAKITLNNLGIKSGILNKVYEDALWTEYINAQTDKGTAAQIVQKHFSVLPNETAAFGDNFNDFGMLRRAQYSFAPKNAKPEIIRMCKYTTNNVVNEISNIIKKGENYERLQNL